MQLVILAGGKGTRLGLTDIPKAMCPINGKPLLEHQINLAKKHGVDEVFILSGHLAHVISDYFGDGAKFDLKIHHIIEPYPLGTAGALKLLKGKLNNRFLVFYGDVVMDFDVKSFLDFDNEIKSIGTILVHPNNHPYDSDLVKVNKDGLVTSFLSKPHKEGMVYKNLVNAAVYIFDPEIMDYIDDGVSQDFGKDILPRLLNEGQKIRAYHTAEYIKDMGTKDRFPHICEDFVKGKVARLNKKNKRPTIFLDRDGVLIKDMDENPKAENLELLSGVSEAIKKINNSDYLSIVVTNQPMIAKGFVSFEDVELANMQLETELGNERAYLDAIYYCPHHPQKGFEGEIPELKVDCQCRKPNTGMFLQATHDFNIDLANSWMIGDRESDMQAGKNCGCKTILVGQTIINSSKADFRFDNLSDAINFILGDENDNN